MYKYSIVDNKKKERNEIVLCYSDEMLDFDNTLYILDTLKENNLSMSIESVNVKNNITGADIVNTLRAHELIKDKKEECKENNIYNESCKLLTKLINDDLINDKIFIVNHSLEDYKSPVIYNLTEDQIREFYFEIDYNDFLKLIHTENIFNEIKTRYGESVYIKISDSDYKKCGKYLDFLSLDSTKLSMSEKYWNTLYDNTNIFLYMFRNINDDIHVFSLKNEDVDANKTFDKDVTEENNCNAFNNIVDELKEISKIYSFPFVTAIQKPNDDIEINYTDFIKLIEYYDIEDKIKRQYNKYKHIKISDLEYIKCQFYLYILSRQKLCVSLESDIGMEKTYDNVVTFLEMFKNVNDDNMHLYSLKNTNNDDCYIDSVMHELGKACKMYSYTLPIITICKKVNYDDEVMKKFKNKLIVLRRMKNINLEYELSIHYTNYSTKYLYANTDYEITLEFQCTVYESSIINDIAKDFLDRINKLNR